MGDAGRGLSGIEYSQQSVLQPEPKPGETGTIHGDNIYLTIDADLQYKLEKIAKNAMETTMAENIMLIAANAVNGEILSYVSLPSANLNAYSFADKEETIDRPAVAAYEPGSVFKIFSVASFLDAGSTAFWLAFFIDYHRTDICESAGIGDIKSLHTGKSF